LRYFDLFIIVSRPRLKSLRGWWRCAFVGEWVMQSPNAN